MAQGKLTVTRRMTRSLPAVDQGAWDTLVLGFAGEVLHPEHVELVITDNYQAVAGEYSVQSPTRANPDMTADDYWAAKPDGAMAAAKTIELPAGKVAVVAAAGLVRLGQAVASRALLHEAQHVRLLQKGNSAYGVHRKVAFARPADIDFGFIWIAESAIDEFRCERAVYEAGVTALGMGSDPADYQDVLTSFEEVRRGLRRTGDVLSGYQAAIAVLDRLAQFLAYAAAHVVFDPATAVAWSSIPQLADLVEIVSGLPSSGGRVTPDQLAERSIEVARFLRRVLQDSGFDSYIGSDGGLYFYDLHR
jgi:hypothetical protein